jgi:acetamidase/formamidase
VTAPTSYLLTSDAPHYAWDNALAPKLRIASGACVTFQTRDAGDEWFTIASTVDDLIGKKFSGHPLTGPVWIEDLRAGDTLQVDILEVKPGSFGWTSFRPGAGLLPDDFDAPYLRTWDLSDGAFAYLGERIRVPLEPFCGVMGVALAAPASPRGMSCSSRSRSFGRPGAAGADPTDRRT